MRLQRARTMPPYTQGAAALYPGLCASALTARAGQYIFCEQVVRVNQEQSHFGYNKLDTLVKNTNIQVVDNLTDNFRGYAALLRKIKQRVLLAQQRVIYAANEEMLRMYWDVGEMLQQSQDADGWGKKTLQRLSVDLKNDYSEIKGFSVRNMQCMIQFFNE